MWKNYIKVTLRNLFKNRVFNLINMAGLAIGLASAIFIILYIVDETGYDRFHERSDRMYRLYIDGKMAGEELKGAWNSPIFGPTFYDEIPEVTNFCRFDYSTNLLLYSNPEEKYLEENILYADSTFFEVFSIDLLEGDPATCLDEPYSILLSESRVDRYFPDGNAMGNTISLNNDSTLYTVTGVVADAPRHSHFTYDFILSYCTRESSRRTIWFNNHMFTYLVLQEGAEEEVVEGKINEVMLEHIRPQLQQFLGISVEEFQANGNRYGIYMQPLTDIHLDPSIGLPNDIGYRPLGNRTYLVIFGVIAFLVLVIAAINFMNLSTARSLSRAKEVSLRKVVGSTRKELVQQFMVESVVLSFISLLIALLAVDLLLPSFNNLAGTSLNYGDLWSWYMIPAFLVLAIFLGLLSGSYPATVLASFKPIQALKGRTTGSNGTGNLRSILVVVQFTISIVIVVGTLVIFWQFRYLLNKDKGFREDHLVVMERVYPLGNDRLVTFKQELLKHSGISGVTNSTAYVGSPNNNNGYKIRGKGVSEPFLFNTFWVDYDFMENYRFELADGMGRFFSREYGMDSTACVINEAAVRKYNLEDPLETEIIWHNNDTVETNLRVIGVVKDFHYSSLKDEIAPMIMILKPNDWSWVGFLTIRIDPGAADIQETLGFMEKTWYDFTEDQPFQYFFLDERLDSYYAEEKRTGIITLIFSILSIFIASLGLFGMTLYNSQKRTREISIRKVMGASESNILTLVSRSVMISLMVAIVIAWPVAWYMMRDWLNNFPYNIGFQPVLFFLAALLALVIALITVVTTSIKAARTNPATALHYE